MMEDVQHDHSAAQPVAASGPAVAAKPGQSRRAQKRRRRRSNEANAALKKSAEDVILEEGGGGGGEKGEKRPRNRQMSISSKAVANHVMMMRLLGSESDPLNLEGVGTGEGEGCPSSGAVSPVFGDSGQPVVPRPPLLQNPRDPLNLEGFLPKKTAAKTAGGSSGKGRRGGRRKTVSVTEEGGPGGGKQEGGRGRGGWGKGGGRGGRRRRSKKMETEQGDHTASSGTALEPPVFRPEDQRYHYGNYDMYYGYRCSSRGSAEVSDPRLGHMKREWFEGKDCLDIGCNTGQITLAIAQHFNPQSIVGIDIDHKLVRIANKNLFRQQIPAVTPDGRAFPSSFTSMAPFSLLSSKIRSSRAASRITSTPQPFPNNISFSQENYVPQSEPEVEAVDQQYDVILALSLTKWIHLNWGDAGLRRTFRKMFRQLRPGGRLLLEPQSFASYTRKKKLTPAIYKNYHAIQFQPSQFQAYLMSGEVGFTKHKFLGVPQHKAEGFRRPLHLYVKSKTSDDGGRGGRESSGKMGDQESEKIGEVGGGGEEKSGKGGERGVEGEGVEEEMETELAGGEGGGGGGRGQGNAAEGERGVAREGERVAQPEAVTNEEQGVVTETVVVEEGSQCGDSVGQERAQRDRTSGE